MELVDASEHGGDEEFLLRREVAVERPLADAGPGRDVVHEDLVEVALPELDRGGREDGLALVVALLASGHRNSPRRAPKRN